MQKTKQKISSPISITIVLFIGVLLAEWIIISQYQILDEETRSSWAVVAGSKKSGGAKTNECAGSGGIISEITCYCSETADFFNSCLIGGCGCSPDPKHARNIKVCDCGEGKCFNGKECVDL